MDSTIVSNTEEPCVVYPWEPCHDNEMQMKASFEDNYLDHMSNLKIESNPSPNTLTTIACGVLHNVTRSLIEEFCESGASMVIFDFNGLSFEQSRKMVYEIRQGVFNYSLKKNNRVPYSMTLVLDLEGSCITTGSIFHTTTTQRLIELSTNAHVYVTNDVEYKFKCTEDRIYVNSDIILKLKINDRIYLDYGKIELAVLRVDEDEVYCVIKRGEFLGSEKVVHVPGIPVGSTALTKLDEEKIRTGIQLKVDVILVPGVRNSVFFDSVRKFVVTERGRDISLYAKIDNTVGLENMDDIIPGVDGVFLNRPNLSMEVGHDKIFLAQKIVLSKCNLAGKPTITYGEYLNSMEVSTVPTSAEVNDLINTVMDGTDCIYLDVTMRSANKLHCIQYAASLCRQGEAAIWEQQLFTELNKKSKPKIDPAQAISIGCVEVSFKCHAAAIIVITTSGLSAKFIARYRPRCPVLAIVRHGKAARKLSVWRNVIALQYIDPIENVWKDIENRTRFAMDFGKRKGILHQGDLVLHMSCSKQNAGFANTMSVFYVSAGDFVNA
ncbi:pyruvate kinase isoform X2 [Acyrthosiphon pisum]|uniref:Pyruvate kinase n=1 Tax=Acyrthosiphon pisum TaxID=7029 RepID=A0A8R2A3J4_ACYPI|nr:pyruvate kinase isoform X1 [Acyrthosiphon pisum]XP_003246076.1 pyruvate kinase isoform X2 [Acyrthosiphon pisum]|eukprot:XP_001944086.1 PREDICTED: pyruvate kinase-like isoform X1 [Acyrthosiphon pisum]